MPRISSVHSNCRRKKSVIHSRNTFFSRFSCHEGALYGRIRLRRGEQDLPEVFARKRASPKASDRRSTRCSGRLRRENRSSTISSSVARVEATASSSPDPRVACSPPARPASRPRQSPQCFRFITPGQSAGYRETAFYLSYCLSKATAPFFKLAARCKHPGFHEELECRAVCFAYRKTLLPNTVKYRNGQFGTDRLC